MILMAKQDAANSKAESMRRVIVNNIHPKNENYDFITEVFIKLQQLESKDK